MQLNLSLTINNQEEQIKKARKSQKDYEEAIKEPSWDEVWNGYLKNGKRKKGILELKNSEPDLARLKEIREAVENDVLALDCPMSKVSKKKLLDLYPLLQEKLREGRISDLIKTKPDNYHIIDSEMLLEAVLPELLNERELGIDTETTGLDIFQDKIIGISFTLPSIDKHIYIPCGYYTGEQQLPRDYVLEKIRPIIESNQIKKFLHNAKYDMHMFLRHGIRMASPIHCSMIGMQILNENEPTKALKNLINKYGRHLGIEQEAHTFEELFGKNAELAYVPILPSGIYACSDTKYCYKLGKWQEGFFEKMAGLHHVFYEIEMPLLPVVVDMERNGFYVDVDFAREYNEELKIKCQELMNGILSYTGDININSNDQMGKFLYDELGLEDISKKRKVDKPTLKKLKNKHPVIEMLLEYRDLFKLQTTYFESLPSKIQPTTNRLHGTFSQASTDTGRFSSQNPNLQNLPYRARHMIKAEQGNVLLGIDFS